MIYDIIIIITELGGPQQADVHAGLLPHSVSPSYFSCGHCLHKVIIKQTIITPNILVYKIYSILLKAPLIYFSVLFA